MKQFDHYSFRARLQPAFLTLLPVALAVFAWTKPGERWVSALWTLMGSAGFTFFLASVARNRGKNIEPQLWAAWGGAPTIQMLRHRGPANPLMRERWHKYLSKLLDRPLPTNDEEQASPAAADATYDAAVILLISKTRNETTFHLVYKESVQYGFCRNLFALRSIGILLAIIGLTVSSIAAAWLWKRDQLPPLASISCAAVCFFQLIWWLLIVKAEWVRIPAYAYAERLFESMENLNKTKPKKKGVERPNG